MPANVITIGEKIKAARFALQDFTVAKEHGIPCIDHFFNLAVKDFLTIVLKSQPYEHFADIQVRPPIHPKHSRIG
jgi:hypothetical protein